MRPLRLVVRKFLGLEHVAIDFQEGDLFVIVGPNGAGKSSILEAIFFALYGRGIRAERGRRELLHRGFPDGSLRVELEFAVENACFRVVREFSLRRGGGAVLERKEKEGERERWRLVEDREQGVNREIEKILGFDANTFRSSVFLAQGETLRFVEATPAERFRILSSLFGLDILDSLRELVREDFNRLEGELAPQEERLRILQEEDLEEEKVSAQRELHAIQGELETLKKREEETRLRIQDLEKLCERSRFLAQEEERRKHLQRERSEALEKVKEDQMIDQARHVEAHFWQVWQEKVRERERMEEERGKKEERWQEIQRDYLHSLALLEERKRVKESLASELNTMRAKREALGEMEPILQEIARLKVKKGFLAKKLNEERERYSSLQEETIALEREVRTLEEELAVSAKIFRKEEEELLRWNEGGRKIEPLWQAVSLSVKELELKRREILRLTEELDKKKKQIEEWKREAERIRVGLQEKQKEERKAGEEYQSALRAFVVAELERRWEEEGKCPMCGSSVPFPGRVHGARRDFVGLERRYEALREEVKKYTARMEVLQEGIVRLRRELETVEEEKRRKEEEFEEVERAKKTAEEAIWKVLSELSWKERSFDWNRFREEYRRREESREELRRKYTQREQKLALNREKSANVKRWQEELFVRLNHMTRDLEELTGDLERKRIEVKRALAVQGIPEDDDLPENLLDRVMRSIWEEIEKKEALFNQVRTEEWGFMERVRLLEGSGKDLEKEVATLDEQLRKCAKEEEERKILFQEELTRLGWSEAQFYALMGKEKGNWQEKLSSIEGALRQVEERIRSLEQEIEVLQETLRVGELLSSCALHSSYQQGRGDFQLMFLSRLDLESLLEWEREEWNTLRQTMGEKENLLGSLRMKLHHLEERIRERSLLEGEIRAKREKKGLLETLLNALEARQFKNYLLRILFQKLEEEASRLLFSLSGERYVLRMRSESGATQMVVVDKRYGQEERFIHECSGGEKTLIALSLALAISRLWLKEQGNNRSANCLFIDEGFSPLDREHLELVADAILRLGKSGKMIGIVTHDELFADYFPLRLEVREGQVTWKKKLDSSPI